MAIAIDTLAYARRLREAGFTDEQAEGQAEALAAAMTDTLATKQDLSELRTQTDAAFREFEARMEAGFAALRHEIRELETRMQAGFASARRDVQELEIRMDARFADFERRITMRMGTVVVAGFGVMSALVKLL
jgi:hypothetical protein